MTLILEQSNILSSETQNFFEEFFLFYYLAEAIIKIVALG